MKFAKGETIETYSDGILHEEPPIGQQINMIDLSIKSIDERLEKIESQIVLLNEFGERASLDRNGD